MVRFFDFFLRYDLDFSRLNFHLCSRYKEKNGPRIAKADLIVINLAPYTFSNLHKDVDLNDIISFIVDKSMLKT